MPTITRKTLSDLQSGDIVVISKAASRRGRPCGRAGRWRITGLHRRRPDCNGEWLEFWADSVPCAESPRPAGHCELIGGYSHQVCTVALPDQTGPARVVFTT
jgi:hypothetical protein